LREARDGDGEAVEQLIEGHGRSESAAALRWGGLDDRVGIERIEVEQEDMGVANRKTGGAVASTALPRVPRPTTNA
jgi:hypothetical protein